TADVLASGCTHVAGNHWSVWATVYHANLVLREGGESREIWGVSVYSRPLAWVWRSRVSPSDVRVAVRRGEERQADFWLCRYGFPGLVVGEERPTLNVLTPGAVALEDGPKWGGPGRHTSTRRRRSPRHLARRGRA